MPNTLPIWTCNEENALLWFDVVLTATEEELLDGLQRAGLRRASNTRLIVQSILLAAVAAWSLVAFFGDGMTEPASLIIAMIALVIIPVMWLVPNAQMKSMARQMGESETKPHMWVFEDGLDFGDTPPANAYYEYSSVFAAAPEEGATLETLVLRFRSDEVVVVPRRLLSDEQWERLLAATAHSDAAQRRHL